MAHRGTVRDLRRAASGLAAALCLAAGVIGAEVEAAPRVSTETLYYDVHGDSANALLSYMLRHGPRGETGRALGTTSAVIRQDAEFVEGSNCQLRNFYVELELTLRLPRLQQGQQLSGATRRNWNNFVNYVTRHENRHKAIYTACARRIDSRVRALNRTTSCFELKSQMRTIFNEENARCDREHVAFDATEESKIEGLPFIVQALSDTEHNQTASGGQSRESRQSAGAGSGARLSSMPIEDLK